MRLRYLIIGLFVLYGSYYGWAHRDLQQPAGILVREAPVQVDIPSEKQHPLMLGKLVMEPLADYSIRARVLSTERYWFDHGADVAPIDLAVGWGPMSDSTNIDQFSIKQSNRFYFYSWRGNPPLDSQEIIRSSANMHIIPGSPMVEKTVFGLRPGQIISLKGKLVRLNEKNGAEWKSSLTRDDTGNGACELMFVTEASVTNY